MFFKNKRTEDLEAYRDITDDVEESDFVPYACLFNPHTIITKNGELLQTLKITGTNRDNLTDETVDLRAALRNALREYIPSNEYAIWFHTLRRKSDLSAPGDFPEGFAAEVAEGWEGKNRFKEQFSNEVYATIVREGQTADILSVKGFFKGLLPTIDLKDRNAYLDRISDELESVVQGMLSGLQEFGVKRLGVVEREGVFYSEQIEFLEKLTNLVERPMPVPQQDLSQYLTSGEITFAFNAMEVRTAEGQRRFSSIISVKEYKEASLSAIDHFLKAPIEFIVTQCVDFINPELALGQYKVQEKVYEVSGDEDMTSMTELDKIIASDRGNAIDFGEQQLSIFLQADTVRQLENYTKKAIEYLAKYGIISFREDIHFEKCYWAQLPGNFEFINRLIPTNTMHIGGFANLHNFPAGQAEGNRWGTAVTSFHTAMGTPYFFNFHHGENGHTSVVGPHGSGKTVLSNFLLSQSCKFEPNLYYFDVSYASQTFVEQLGGLYQPFFADATQAQESGHAIPALNPFVAEGTPEYLQFLKRWLTVLVRATGGTVEGPLKTAIGAAVDAVYTEPSRTFGRFIAQLEAIDPAYGQAFAMWQEGGALGHVYNHASDAFATPTKVQSFDLTHVADNPTMFVPLASYLLQRVTMVLDGTPSILMLDEAWRLLRSTHIAADLAGWMGYLTSQNALGIYTTEYVDEAGADPLTPVLFSGLATQVFLPNGLPSEVYKEGFGLSHLEFTYVGSMDVNDRHFLLKQAGNAIVAEMNLAGLDSIIEVLSGDEPQEPSQHEGWQQQSVAV